MIPAGGRRMRRPYGRPYDDGGDPGGRAEARPYNDSVGAEKTLDGFSSAR